MLVVAALGGNALLRRNEPLEAEIQRRNIFDAVVKAIAPLARKHGLVITHGNGPQIGLLALQAAAYKAVAPIVRQASLGGRASSKAVQARAYAALGNRACASACRSGDDNRSSGRACGRPARASCA
jgi:hypothetical protein